MYVQSEMLSSEECMVGTLSRRILSNLSNASFNLKRRLTTLHVTLIRYFFHFFSVCVFAFEVQRYIYVDVLHIC